MDERNEDKTGQHRGDGCQARLALPVQRGVDVGHLFHRTVLAVVDVVVADSQVSRPSSRPVDHSEEHVVDREQDRQVEVVQSDLATEETEFDI